MRRGVSGASALFVILVPQFEIHPLAPFLEVPGALKYTVRHQNERGNEISHRSLPCFRINLRTKLIADTAQAPFITACIEGTRIQVSPVGVRHVCGLRSSFNLLFITFSGLLECLLKMGRAHLRAAKRAVQYRWEWRGAITQTDIRALLHEAASCPSPCLIVILFNRACLHMIGILDIRAYFTLLDGVTMAGAIGVLLRREVWQGSLGTTDIVTLQNVVAAVITRAVVEATTCVVGLELILRDTTTLGKIIASITSVSRDVFASTS